jgi:hypothetical protein
LLLYRLVDSNNFRIFAKNKKAAKTKKQGAAGITTAAPHVAGQWGRGDNRLPK